MYVMMADESPNSDTEEVRVADAPDDALQQVVEAEIRVGHAGPQRHHAETRDDIHGRQPEAERAEEQRRRKGEQQGIRHGGDRRAIQRG